MALASAYGLNFQLPQSGQPSVPTRNAGQQQMSDPFGSGNLLEDDLYVKEGMTDEYYKKVAALKSFANEVSARYGFDVTKPDYRNPDSIRFHRSYLEALSDLQSTQNRLKRLATQENISLQNPNIARGTDDSGNDYFANVGSNDIVRRMAEAAARVRSKEGAEGFEVAREDMIEQMQLELESAQTPQERDQLMATIRQLESITVDTGISESAQAQYDLQREQMAENRSYRERELSLRERQIAQREQPSIYGNLTKNQQTLLNGRIERISELINPESLKTKGYNRVDRASGTYIERTINGKTESVKIDPNDPRGTLENINDLLNKSQGSKVSMDLFYGTNLDIDGIASEIVSNMNPVEDKFSEFVEMMPVIASKAASNDQVRSSLASSLSVNNAVVPAGVSVNFDGGKAENAKITSVEQGSSMFGNNPYIEIKLEKGKNNKTPKKKFYLDDPQDIKMLQEIFKENSRAINLPPNIQDLMGLGTDIAPASSGGVDIDMDSM